MASPILRLMTYNICGFQNYAEKPWAEIIREAQVQIVTLQNILPNQVRQLAVDTTLQAYSPHQATTAFLSSIPLKCVQEIHLGDGARCLTGEGVYNGYPFHIFNLFLQGPFFIRPWQLRRLAGPELLGNRSQSVATILLGDTAGPSWNFSLPFLRQPLKRAVPKGWSGTYPTPFPFYGRDRVYLRGSVILRDIRIDNSPQNRQASRHLPVIAEVELQRPGITAQVEEKWNKDSLPAKVVPG